MDVLRRQTPPSTLNPNAPAFIPMVYYDVVEDFSDEWWSLVHSSPWFRDYWLTECFEDPQSDALINDSEDQLLSDLDSFFDDFLRKRTDLIDLDSELNSRSVFVDFCLLRSDFLAEEEVEEDKKRSGRELISVNALGWNKARGKGEAPRFGEKAPKIVNVKVSPRPIQQPR
ncbi:hypothetical protein V2J09_012534 [Rumex salicifolius]